MPVNKLYQAADRAINQALRLTGPGKNFYWSLTRRSRKSPKPWHTSPKKILDTHHSSFLFNP